MINKVQFSTMDRRVTVAIDNAIAEFENRGTASEHETRVWIVRAIVLDVIAAITVMGGLIAFIVR